MTATANIFPKEMQVKWPKKKKKITYRIEFWNKLVKFLENLRSVLKNSLHQEASKCLGSTPVPFRAVKKVCEWLFSENKKKTNIKRKGDILKMSLKDAVLSCVIVITSQKNRKCFDNFTFGRVEIVSGWSEKRGNLSGYDWSQTMIILVMRQMKVRSRAGIKKTWIHTHTHTQARTPTLQCSGVRCCLWDQHLSIKESVHVAEWSFSFHYRSVSGHL